MCQRSLPNGTGALIGAQFAGPGATAVIGEIGYQRGVEGGLIAFYRVLRGKEVTARVDFSNGITSKGRGVGACRTAEFGKSLQGLDIDNEILVSEGRAALK